MSGKFKKKVRYQKKYFNIYKFRSKEYKFIETPKLIKKKIPQDPKLKLKPERKSSFDLDFDVFSQFFRD